MQIGLQLSSFTWPGGPQRLAPILAQIGRETEEAGFASIWVMDHFFQIAMIGKAEEPMLEGYNVLGYLAGVTRRVKLGTLVTAVTYRHPGILAKTATSLDVLSGGRAYFGIGAGWFEREAAGLGIPFPPIKERFERLEECLKICLQMWSNDVAPYNGKYYHLAETLNSPQPISRPHPPILIGGVGEKKTLPLVAKYADACNVYAHQGVAAVRAKLQVLRRECEAIGRNYDDIERTAIGEIALGAAGMTAREAIEYCRSFSDAGVRHLIVSIPGVSEIKPIVLMGKEVIPAVAEL